jgi:hypothetical protein
LRDVLAITAEEFQGLIAESWKAGLRIDNVSLDAETFDACSELVLSSGRKLYHLVSTLADPQTPVDRGLWLSHIFSRAVFTAAQRRRSDDRQPGACPAGHAVSGPERNAAQCLARAPHAGDADSPTRRRCAMIPAGWCCTVW